MNFSVNKKLNGLLNEIRSDLLSINDTDGEFAQWLVGEDLMSEDWEDLYESWKGSEE